MILSRLKFNSTPKTSAHKTNNSHLSSHTYAYFLSPSVSCKSPASLLTLRPSIVQTPLIPTYPTAATPPATTIPKSPVFPVAATGPVYHAWLTKGTTAPRDATKAIVAGHAEGRSDGDA